MSTIVGKPGRAFTLYHRWIGNLIKEGENGFLFRLNDSDKAVSDLCRLIEDKNIYEAMATKAAESAKQYDAKNVVGQYDKIWGLK
mgnify:CR=1 FL=1